MLAGCLSSNPTQPDALERVIEPAAEHPGVEEVGVDEPAAVETARSAGDAPAKPERERRARRRSKREEPKPGASAEVIEVPARAAQGYARAVDAMAVDNWLEAELELEQLVLEYETFPGPYVNLAIVYMHDGRDEEARQALDKALGIDPTHAEANNQLAIMLRRQGDFAGAEAAYRTAIGAHPEYGLAYRNLGVLLDLYLRRQSEALSYYETYQDSLAEPDEQVALWIIDLRRQLGASERAERVAQEDGL